MDSKVEMNVILKNDAVFLPSENESSQVCREVVRQLDRLSEDKNRLSSGVRRWSGVRWKTRSARLRTAKTTWVPNGT